MKPMILSGVLAVLSACPLAAEPCRPGTDGIQAPSCGPIAGAVWAPFPPVTTPADELSRQAVRNTAHRRRTYDAVAAAGGCNAASVPVEYAAYCWRQAGDANPTGGPLGASSGGSD